MTATALPAASTATTSTATEADVKNWLTSLHDFLSGLLGTTGVPADARTALGVPTSFVTSFNTRTGTVTLTSTDVTSALGFTPANASLSVLANAVVSISDEVPATTSSPGYCVATRASGATFTFAISPIIIGEA